MKKRSGPRIEPRGTSTLTLTHSVVATLGSALPPLPPLPPAAPKKTFFINSTEFFK